MAGRALSSKPRRPATRKRTKDENPVVIPSDKKEPIYYCRVCQEIKKEVDFYDAVDTLLDKSGKMSVCKSCMNDIFERYYQMERELPRAILKACRTFNVAYVPTAVEATQTYIASKLDKGSDPNNLFGFYKSRMSSMNKLNPNQLSVFEEPSTNLNSSEPMVDDGDPDTYDLIQYWGEGWSVSDYQFLERELADWRKTHKSDTKAEITLLKEICFKQLEIRKARLEGKSADALLKSLQDLMKTASVDPAKAAIAGAGKSLDTFSSFIKTIEENEPAEVYKDRALFKDFDNLDFYFRKYVTRPLKNFITQSRDFNVETDEDGEDDFDINAPDTFEEKEG